MSCSAVWLLTGRFEPDLIGPPARPEELLGLEDILLTADSLAFRDS